MTNFSIVGNVFVSGSTSNVLNESEKLLMKKAIKGKDTNILTSIVEKHANKNPLVDAKTKETILHYIAYRLDGLDLFVSIANQIDNLYVKNRNGETPIEIAASHGHIRIIQYICFKTMSEMYESYKKGKEEFVGSKFLKKVCQKFLNKLFFFLKHVESSICNRAMSFLRYC